MTRHPFWQAVLILFSLAGILLAVNQIFHLRLLGVQVQLSYLYAILAIFGSLAFLFFPARRGTPRRGIPWYDVLLFLFVLGTGLYLAWRGYDVLKQTWSLVPPTHALVLAFLLWIVLIEAVRRVAGATLTIVAIFFSVYPVFAPYLPGMLQGPPVYTLKDVAAYHILGFSSVMGMPMQVVAELVIGYIIFGTTLQYTGGGKFFLDLAFAVFGTVRGGVAKVAIVSSGLFGSLSGSPISNVLTTGPVTIPAMKKSGYPAHYAGAVEACASTGGSLMPPVMGAAAFIMAMILDVSYYQVALAAAVPSLLYYYSLFIQVDAYAARVGLKGLSRAEVPSLWQAFKGGWYYLFALALLLVFLFYFRWVAEAPFIAAAALLAAAMMRKETRFNLKGLQDFIVANGKFLAELTVLLAAVGFIMGSFFLTGLGASFAQEFTRLAGGNLLLLLVFSAVASFILGMGMTISAAYIFLAITVGPVLAGMGVNPMAAHLFMLYWAMISYITPPVALAAMAAAPLAGVSGMKIGLASTRLGTVKYIVPFFFVLSPALVLQEATAAEMVLHIATAVVGVTLLGGALERYVLGIGEVKLPLAALFFLAGLMLFYPNWLISLAGLVLAVAAVASLRLRRKLGKRSPQSVRADD